MEIDIFYGNASQKKINFEIYTKLVIIPVYK